MTHIAFRTLSGAPDCEPRPSRACPDPFKHGLTIALVFAIVICLLAAWAS